MDPTPHGQPPRRNGLILRSVAILSAFGIIGGLLWLTRGPTASTGTQQCTVTGEPQISHGRRSISHSVETSCGKLGISPEKYFTARMGIEVGKSYEFNLEKRPFGIRIVGFEEG